MTCIVAIHDRGQVFFGADSSVLLDDDTRRRTRDPKIWRTSAGPIVGAAGDGAWCTWLHWSVVWPTVPVDWARWIATLLGPAPDGASGVALLGTPDGLWEFDEGLDPYQPAEPFAAIGSGAEPAIGALYAASRRLGPRKRLALALEAAERYTTYVQRPFRYL